MTSTVVLFVYRYNLYEILVKNMKYELTQPNVHMYIGI